MRWTLTPDRKGMKLRPIQKRVLSPALRAGLTYSSATAWDRLAPQCRQLDAPGMLYLLQALQRPSFEVSREPVPWYEYRAAIWGLESFRDISSR